MKLSFSSCNKSFYTIMIKHLIFNRTDLNIYTRVICISISNFKFVYTKYNVNKSP